MAINIKNPFSIAAYLGSEYFCDRVEETNFLLKSMKNASNVTLISPRKMGKTGLIRHFFNSVDTADANCFYIDIYGTSNIQDFTKRFAEEVLTRKITPFTQRAWKSVSTIFGALRPVFSYDGITGTPQCMVDIKPTTEEVTIRQIFAYLESSNKPCYVAFDEFQEVADYKDCKMEAILRSHIQHLTNVHFIFAGSKKHIMSQIFLSANRPFYQSTTPLHLKEIAEDEYYKFASRHFEKNRQTITEDAFHYLYSLVEGATWYVQKILHELYQDGIKSIDNKAVTDVIKRVVQENGPTYQTLCSLITPMQVSVLKAIAIERTLLEPNSKEFLSTYSFENGSSVRYSIDSLLDKELLYEKDGEYSVYDKFMGMWLRNDL